MKTRVRLVAILAALFVFGTAAAAPAFAGIRPSEELSNPKLEARAREIGSQLRCLVCQNESINDSDADLAHDLRVLVRKLLLKGDTNAQVKAYIVARYGNYVLLKPPFLLETYLLWIGPALFLIAAAGLAVFFYRRNVTLAGAMPLSSEEQARVAALVGHDASDAEER